MARPAGAVDVRREPAACLGREVHDAAAGVARAAVAGGVGGVHSGDEGVGFAAEVGFALGDGVGETIRGVKRGEGVGGQRKLLDSCLIELVGGAKVRGVGGVDGGGGVGGGVGWGGGCGVGDIGVVGGGVGGAVVRPCDTVTGTKVGRDGDDKGDGGEHLDSEHGLRWFRFHSIAFSTLCKTNSPQVSYNNIYPRV